MNYGKESLSKKKKNVSSKKNMKKNLMLCGKYYR